MRIDLCGLDAQLVELEVVLGVGQGDLAAHGQVGKMYALWSGL
jgi:hypothetical protein